MKSKAKAYIKIKNFRQLGGYKTADNKFIRWGVLLRSGTLFGASEKDIKILEEEYRLSAIIDLRSENETECAPDPEIKGAEYFSVPVLDGETDSSGKAAIINIYQKNGGDIGKAYVEMVRAGAFSADIYSGFLKSKKSLLGFRKFFDILLEKEGKAVLWHCTGGKDRTGIAAVLLLSILGAKKEDILFDFTQSNEMNKKSIEHIVSEARKHTDDESEIETVRKLAGVSAECMELAFTLAERESGSMNGFIKEKIGITDSEIEKLREFYLFDGEKEGAYL